MSWRSESPFTVGFRAYVGFWFHCSPNPISERLLLRLPARAAGKKKTSAWLRLLVRVILQGYLGTSFTAARRIRS
ncbi:hypothetical protein DZA28_29525 [Pseudomonas alloputida]|uniref:Uncharacterized protein n=1 Tax=Pseudomonas alloputida TaxID=1940621 RepID=A0ABY3CXK6_9PSED|nr:hypothetical protein DZA28_29525 [Pseudomonas alloputida]